jgi:hypothetical protein
MHGDIAHVAINADDLPATRFSVLVTAIRERGGAIRYE